MINAVINGTGSYLPETILTNYDLEKTLDTKHEWILSRTGISSRHIAAEYESTSSMAAQAAQIALEASSIDANELDLILVATCTPDYFFPSVACQVQKALSLKKPVPALDISAACSGFIYALDIAKQYINSGNAKHILVIGSETMSRTLDWTDRSTCILFGDGAGALILSANDEAGILGSSLYAAHDDELLTYPNFTNETQKAVISMCGKEVFKLAVDKMGEIVEEVLAKSYLKQSDITWLIPHQANIRIIQAISKKLHLPMERVITTIEDQGNTSAASIPIALDFAIRKENVKRGDLLLLESFGGGMTWGAMAIRY